VSPVFLQNEGPLLNRLIGAQRVEEEAVRYPQIEMWANALVNRARQLPGCLIWPVGAPAERIAGVAVARARGHIEVGLWNGTVEGRTVLLFAVAGVTPLSLILVAKQLRGRGAGEVHACGVAITGAGEVDGIESFGPLADELHQAVGPVAA
jgi:hypothetical protein